MPAQPALALLDGNYAPRLLEPFNASFGTVTGYVTGGFLFRCGTMIYLPFCCCRQQGQLTTNDNPYLHRKEIDVCDEEPVTELLINAGQARPDAMEAKDQQGKLLILPGASSSVRQTVLIK